MNFNYFLRLGISGAIALLPLLANAQSNDPVLFHIGGDTVRRSEFEYIYKKNNGTTADFSKKSVEDYLDLYTKFKLKVHKARVEKLDTILVLQQELAGYRKQLAQNFLMDKQMSDRLVREVYDRSAQDVEFAHILIRCVGDAPAADTVAAYQRIKDIEMKLRKGASFENLAADLSEDVDTKTKGGVAGWFTAPFPYGFYSLETTVYGLAPGKISNIIRTPVGYHIVKTTQVRPARGEMEVAHILCKDKRDDGKSGEEVIKTVAQELKNGMAFEDAVEKYSDDKLTYQKSGYIGFFGINRYDINFENAAFALPSDGSLSAPVKTTAGWHIIKRISLKKREAYDLAKRRLEPRISKDPRYASAKTALLNTIKKEGNVTEHRSYLNAYARGLKDDFFSPAWKGDTNSTVLEETILTIGGSSKTIADFQKYCSNNITKRQNLSRNNDKVAAIYSMYDEYVNDACMKFEEQRLDQVNTDFKNLMREYQEGILLFEIAKREVWDKAPQDSVGLEKFYRSQPKGKYSWEDRADVVQYIVHNTDMKLAEMIREFTVNNNSEKTVAKFDTSGKLLTVKSIVVEKGKNPMVDQMKWTTGSISQITDDKKLNGLVFYRFNKFIPAQPKSLAEAKGYVIADYQEHLEKQWIEELKKKYPIQIDKNTLNQIIK